MGKTPKHKIVQLIIDDSSSDSEENDVSTKSEEIDKVNKKENPKAIIQKIVGNKEVVTNGDDIVSKMFTYEEADVLVILDSDSKPWYKGKDICDILEYTNPIKLLFMCCLKLINT